MCKKEKAESLMVTLATNNNDFEVTSMESLLIKRDHPPLNKNKPSLPLELFDS